MVRQRLHQPLGHRRRPGRWTPALAALGLGLTLGCGGQLRDPLGLGDKEHSGTTSVRPSPLIGTWQAILIVDAGVDLQKWTTEWTFGANLTCRLFKKTQSVVEGTTRTTDRPCSYVDRGTEALVTFTDTGATLTLPYRVPLNSTQRLFIEDIEYFRIS